MLRLFLKLYWKFFGWKISGTFPHQYKKIVLAVAPHTHWVDVMTGFIARQALQIEHAKFLGKKELFVWPLGWILRKMGGTPVDRFAKKGMVDQVVALFNAHETFMLGISPEGTRKRVDSLRTGFYHIAKKAGVPIVPIGFDYANRRVVVGDAFFPGEDEAADLKKIIAFYADITGKRPELDLRHLKQPEDASN
ncbi:MAG: 1-acyl-sn-glycerol-3-phosphate acyltransferase [Chitinophagaceae bacterium]|nr:1-acyl-sn-glycerol-3-phosphate acyltransferase [Chitinophagaceae bacterium]